MCRVLLVSKAGFYTWCKRPTSIGERCGRKRVVLIMRAANLRGKRRKAFRVTTNSKHSKPIVENVLDRKFAPEEIAAPNRVWAGDITYIRTLEGWLYLAVLLDLFSRRVIGWAMSHRMGSKVVLDALQMAVVLLKFGAHRVECRVDVRGAKHPNDHVSESGFSLFSLV